MVLWRLLLSTVGGVSIWTKQHCTNTQIHLHCLKCACTQNYRPKGTCSLTEIINTDTQKIRWCVRAHTHTRSRARAHSFMFTEAIDMRECLCVYVCFYWLRCSSGEDDADDAVDALTAALLCLCLCYVSMINWPLSWYSVILFDFFDISSFIYFDRVILCHNNTSGWLDARILLQWNWKQTNILLISMILVFCSFWEKNESKNKYE